MLEIPLKYELQCDVRQELQPNMCIFFDSILKRQENALINVSIGSDVAEITISDVTEITVRKIAVYATEIAVYATEIAVYATEIAVYATEIAVYATEIAVYATEIAVYATEIAVINYKDIEFSDVEETSVSDFKEITVINVTDI
ncbi:hypothetical protein BgiMline_015260 [Biomphalaria glabrata]